MRIAMGIVVTAGLQVVGPEPERGPGAVSLPLIELRGPAFWQGPPAFDHGELISTKPNRWSEDGMPAIYLAGDIGLTLVEAGRHLPEDPVASQTRVIWTLRVEVSGIVDLRAGEVRTALSLDDDHWFLDRARCLTVVRIVRGSPGASGMLVPSAGLPDDPDRWNLVLYPDRLTEPLPAVVLEPAEVGQVAMYGPASRGPGSRSEAPTPPPSGTSRRATMSGTDGT
jgi:RES domain-containing protein